MINKKLLSTFTEHLFKEKVKFLLLIHWPKEDDQSIQAGKLTFVVNGRSNDIRKDIAEFLAYLDKLNIRK